MNVWELGAAYNGVYRIARLLDPNPWSVLFDQVWLAQVIGSGIEFWQALALANPDYPPVRIDEGPAVGHFPYGFNVEPDQPP